MGSSKFTYMSKSDMFMKTNSLDHEHPVVGSRAFCPFACELKMSGSQGSTGTWTWEWCHAHEAGRGILVGFTQPPKRAFILVYLSVFLGFPFGPLG